MKPSKAETIKNHSLRKEAGKRLPARTMRLGGFPAKDFPHLVHELEKMVLKRTSELVTANRKLEAEIAERKEMEKELRASREQLRRLSDHLQAVREEERISIARDIHDELGQTLTAADMDLSLLKKGLKNQDPLREKLQSVREVIESSIDTVNAITAKLRPRILDHLGLVPAIEWQAKEFSKRTSIGCDVNVSCGNLEFGRELSTALFRILQEALTNVARHANATKVEVSLKIEDGLIALEVRDNGRGITKKKLSQTGSFGIIGMEERARQFGGKITFKGVRGKGTTVTVKVPPEGKVAP